MLQQVWCQVYVKRGEMGEGIWASELEGMGKGQTRGKTGYILGLELKRDIMKQGKCG